MNLKNKYKIKHSNYKLNNTTLNNNNCYCNEKMKKFSYWLMNSRRVNQNLYSNNKMYYDSLKQNT